MSSLPELKKQGEKAIAFMRSLNYQISPLNIIYFEGLDADDLATANSDRTDYWNDVRAVIAANGDVLLAAIATTEPGWYYRLNRLNPDGAAQLAFGQHLDCWEIGDHKGQDALVQCAPLKIFRDSNEDGSRAGDPVFTSDGLGLNQHTTSNAPDMVGRWSAGCLVGKYPSTHREFMRLCRSMNCRTFDTTLIAGDEFVRWSEK